MSIPDRPFWFGRNSSILELPLTRGFTGLIGHFFKGRLATTLDHPILGVCVFPASYRAWA